MSAIDRTRLAGPLPRDLATATRDALEVEKRRLTDTINEAYWSFSRSRGLPPSIAVPGVYARRTWVDEAMRRSA